MKNIINRNSKKQVSSVEDRLRVVDRDEWPIVVRGDTSSRWTTIRVLAVLGFVIWLVVKGMTGGISLPDLNQGGQSVAVLSRDLKVESLTLESKSVGASTYWQVRGLLVNRTSSEGFAPDLQVRLVRPGGSIAAQDIVRLRGQRIDSGSALPFQTKMRTDLDETVQVEVVPVISSRRGER